MKSSLSLLLAILVASSLLQGQQPTGGAGPTAGPSPVVGNTPAISTPSAKPVIPDDPDIQIVAAPVCHAVTAGAKTYEAYFAAAGGNVKVDDLPDCSLSSETAIIIDRDMEKAAGIGEATISAVQSLVETTLNNDLRFKRSFGALVHLVRYDDPEPSTTDQAVDRDVWLVCNRGGKDPVRRGLFECGTDLRLYGRHNVAVLYVHTNIVFSSLDPALEAADIAQLRNLDAGSVAYYGLAKSKTPTPLENLQAIFQFASAGAVASTVSPRVALLGHGFFYKMPVPSNLTVVAAREQETGIARVGAKAELLNEGLYFLDFSLGVPVTKITGTEFSEANGTFEPKEIDRKSVYGLANIYFLPVDLSAGKRRYWMPRAILGVGLTGSLGRSFVVGGSLGPPFLQFFVASEFAKKDFALSNGSTESRFGSRLTYGINIPILSAVQKVQAKKSE